MRDKYLDVAKGIGIILVVMVHSSVLSMQADVWVNQFYMPMFFVISGYLLGKYNKLNSFDRLKKSVAKFVSIYFCTCVGLLAIRAVMLFRQDVMSVINARSIVCILWGRFYDPGNPWVTDDFFSGHLWFLTAMTVSYIMLFLVTKLSKDKLWRYVVGVVVLVVVAQIFRGTQMLLPWCIDVAPVTTLFMLAGYLIGRKDGFNTPLSWKIGVVDVVCIGMFVVLHDVYDIHMRNYGTQQNVLGILFFTVVALSGSVLVIRISRYLSRIPLVGRGLSYLGENSLSIFLWHILWIVMLGPFVARLSFAGTLVQDVIFVASVVICSLITQKVIHDTYHWFFRK